MNVCNYYNQRYLIRNYIEDNFDIDYSSASSFTRTVVFSKDAAIEQMLRIAEDLFFNIDYHLSYSDCYVQYSYVFTQSAFGLQFAIEAKQIYNNGMVKQELFMLHDSLDFMKVVLSIFYRKGYQFKADALSYVA